MEQPMALAAGLVLLLLASGLPATEAEGVCAKDLAGGVPAYLCFGIGEVTALTAGTQHTCVLTNLGNVDCYGANHVKQSESYREGDAIAVDAGRQTTCILRANGTVKCQGQNDAGQAPSYDGGDAVAVSAGKDVTCIVLATGNATCHGSNYLGKGEPYTGGDAVDVSAGTDHVCFLKVDGNVTCQGSWEFGQSGDYNRGDAIAVSAGGVHTCVLLRNGNVDCYGYTWAGEDYALGDAVSIATGSAHTCILLERGDVMCHGNSGYGAPTDYTGGDAVAVAAAGHRTCVLVSSGTVHCWGQNDQGEAAEYVGTPSEPPASLDSVPGVGGRIGWVTLSAPARAAVNETVRFTGEAYGVRTGPGATPTRLAPATDRVEILLDGEPIAETTTDWSWFWSVSTYQVEVPLTTSGGMHTLQAVTDRGTPFEGRSDIYLITVITDPPVAPTNLQTLHDPGKTLVKWTQPEAELSRSVAGYKVVRTLEGDDQPLVTAWWRATYTSFTDSMVEPNTTYTWHVWAWNEAGYSPEVTITSTTAAE